MDLAELTEKKNRAGTRFFENRQGEIVAKECTKCGEVKELEEFGKSPKRTGGVRSACKTCEVEMSRVYYNRNKQYYAEWHIKNRERRLKKRKERYAENREHELAINREWAARHKDRFKIYTRRWRANNPEKARAIKLTRRSKEMSLPYNFEEEDMEFILSRFKGCALTGEPEKIHWDHVIPLSVGRGGTIRENMIPLRADLNISKSDRCIFDWFADNRERFGLSQRKFDELIEYLADINGMTVEEYEEYVRWCHDNPRSIDEIETEEQELAEA